MPNLPTKITLPFISLLIASLSWKRSSIHLMNSDFKYSQKKRPGKGFREISGSFLLTGLYSIKAWFIAQASLRAAVLKHLLKPYTLEKKLFLFLFVANMNKFVMQQH